ncbi:membrane protein [Altererythrobacter sp. B11]|uniref:stage II sporulation protein M n=1 Tax=Altererythrobacter sp. B11 TaxID=2060312 RepID=UPI000DC70754|nr:stage II sporulation protein M [Altererythrobacter sp. B11]BBC74419.1 membrane protein [Altererythrobacter sp. B11]
MALSLRLTFRKSGDGEAPPDIEAASLRSDRFRLEREGEWRRLERIVTALEKGRPGRISDEDLLALPALYRQAASSLSVARETSLDAATLAYLEALVRRAFFQIYGTRQSLLSWLRGFLGGRWGAAVRGLWLDLCIALAVMIAGAVAGWLLVARDSEWYYALVPGEFVGGRQPGAEREVLERTLAGAEGPHGLSVFATYLFSNNAAVAIMAFALGFAFGIPTIMLLVGNMATLGAMLWLFCQAGLGWEFAAWLSIHGTTEIFAILLAGAAGIHIGRSMAFPGTLPLGAAAATSGRRAAQVMAGVVLMLVLAGLLEGYGRQLVEDPWARGTIGGTLLLFWIAYLFAFRPAGEGTA